MDVNIWEEQVIIPTYPAGVPDKNPMFFENRVYQGSSGVVYPNPVIEKISDEKVDRAYKGLFLENDYLKIMILPELGGRVQMAYDKIAGRHFIYYNQVIKPALVGLCGPWISGGIEFNWPQHHRPSTFEPVDYLLEEHDDGSKTVWVNEVEKMFHTKGMAGFTLHPDKAYLEIKAKLYNRTSLPQTFLWWANPAVKVNDDYQSVFPPDVNAVFDHGKRDVSAFPIATGTYYKVDYSPGTDISRYKNIPVPTSYMAVNSNYNFVGGYEHDTRAGVLHVADHHVSPGKKQWTWGNGDFGTAWDRNLTDEDGPYIELMTGVFADNQPDFSWLMPYEEKTFTQYFLPYRELGMVKNASKDILIGFEQSGQHHLLRLFATAIYSDVRLEVFMGDALLFFDTLELSPTGIYEKTLENPENLPESAFRIVLSDNNGREMLKYAPAENQLNAIPSPALAAKAPADIDSVEQLFLTGHHLEQYRHATFSAIAYYEEALRRDHQDIRNNNALGLWYLRRGCFAKSEPYFRKAVKTLVSRNPNPYDSEAYYNLALSLKYQQKTNEAYDAFFKATWSKAWQDTGYFAITQIDILRGHYELALEHIDHCIDANARHNQAYVLKALALRKLNRIEEAHQVIRQALKQDAFNLGALFEQYCCAKQLGATRAIAFVTENLLKLSRAEAHTLTDYAIDYADAGAFTEAIELLQFADDSSGCKPMVKYHLACWYYQLGNEEAAAITLNEAANADPAYTFPNRLADIGALEFALQQNKNDARAPYYLGNLWYDKRQYDKAIQAWELSTNRDDTFPTVFRNLAIAAFNKQGEPEKALHYFERAFRLNTSDDRVLMELDQLYKRLNYAPQTRLEFLEQHLDTANNRDDLYLEIAALYNFKGDYERAWQLIMARKFHPWEGGEGKVSGQYLCSLVELAKADLKSNNLAGAIQKLEQAQVYPHNLGEGKLRGAQENDIFYWLGCAYQAMNDMENARLSWEKAKYGLAEPGAAIFYNDQQPDKILYQGLALTKLGEPDNARQVFEKLLNYGMAHQNDKVKLDYFAVSLPDLLIFEDDLQKRNRIHCTYMAGLGYLGLGRFSEAEAALNTVLENDAMHFGAKTHLNLILLMKGEPVSVSALSDI